MTPLDHHPHGASRRTVCRVKGLSRLDGDESHYGPGMAHCGDPVARQNISQVLMVVILARRRVQGGRAETAFLLVARGRNPAPLRRSRIPHRRCIRPPAKCNHCPSTGSGRAGHAPARQRQLAQPTAVRRQPTPDRGRRGYRRYARCRRTGGSSPVSPRLWPAPLRSSGGGWCWPGGRPGIWRHRY